MKNIVQTFNLEDLASWANAIADITEGAMHAAFILPAPKTVEEMKAWISQNYLMTAGVLETVHSMADFLGNLFADHELKETAVNPVDNLEEYGS